MIGFIDQYNQPKLELTVRFTGKTITTAFLIDTGFAGELCLSQVIIEELKLPRKGLRKVELADGTIRNLNFYEMQVKIFNRFRKATVIPTQSDEALIGIGLFKNRRLIIDFKEKLVEIF